MNRRFYLAFALRQAALRFWVIGTVNFFDFSCVGVLDNPGAFDNIRVAKAHFVTW